jgi:hypothetical protein
MQLLLTVATLILAMPQSRNDANSPSNCVYNIFPSILNTDFELEEYNMKNKFVPIEKQSKKAQREYNAAKRTVVKFNTGTRTHNTDKHPSRARVTHLMHTQSD